MDEIRAISDAMVQLGKMRRGKRYPVELKQRAISAALKLRERGETFRRAADRMGIRWETLRRWCHDSSKTKKLRRKALIPVSVQPAPAPRESGLALVTPSGLRLEGANVDEAVEVMRRLW